MTDNKAIGWGANPARPGTPGGGSGGAIYTDGDNYNVLIEGSIISDNCAREGGGGIFFVVDNNHGTLTIKDSTLHRQPERRVLHGRLPGIFFHSSGHPDRDQLHHQLTGGKGQEVEHEDTHAQAACGDNLNRSGLNG